MKAVILPQYNRNVLRAILGLKTVQADPTIPQAGEVLVRMHAAACNPSDIAFIRGAYNIVKELPAIPGFEGSGIIVDTGPGLTHLKGRKVSCFVQSDKSGTWCEEFLAKESDILLLDEAFDMNQAAMFSVNPFTAYGLMEIAKIRESKAVIQNAGGGQVAAFVNILASIQDVQVVNIVRRQETAEKLMESGIQHVLSEQDPDFEENLQNLVNTLGATTAFDAVGGPLAGKMFNTMPPDAELVCYGGLSGKHISEINEMDLIFQNKIISGFNLMDWKAEMDAEDFDKVNDELQQLFLSERMKTHIQESFQLEDIVKGLKTYIGNMSKGKILIRP